MKKLILILALMFCLIFSVNTLAFEKVDVTGTNFDTTVIFVAKIQTFLDHGLGTGALVVAYEEGEPILQVYGTCDSVDGATIATPVYVHSILTGLGAVGRAAEFVLAPTAQMGGYGNAVKVLLDVSATNGSVGLLAGLCAEVVTPATAQSGTIACVEHEIVATEGLTLSDVIGSANTLNFMQFALSGHGAAVTEVDNHGQFMIVNGLTPLAGNMLSANYVTLKCGVNELAKYLVLSHNQDMLSIGLDGSPIAMAQPNAIRVETTTATTGLVPVEVDATYTGTTGSHNAIIGTTEYNPAVEGYGWINAIAGKLTLAAGKEFDGGQGGLYAGQFQLDFGTSAIMDESSSIFAALRGVLTGTTPVLTNFSVLANLYLDNLIAADLSGQGEYGSSFIAIQNHGGAMDHAISIFSGPTIDNLFAIYGTPSFLTGGSAATGSCVKLKIKVGTVGTTTYYINCYDTNN